MFSAYEQVGLRPVAPAMGGTVSTATQAIARTDDDVIGPLSIGNPLVWLGIFALVTVGAASAAGSVRLGKVKVSASAGK
jgi:hypothetical protein